MDDETVTSRTKSVKGVRPLAASPELEETDRVSQAGRQAFSKLPAVLRRIGHTSVSIPTHEMPTLVSPQPGSRRDMVRTVSETLDRIVDILTRILQALGEIANQLANAPEGEN